MENITSPKILWLTNLPAPYRFPIWDYISKHFQLNVSFLLKEENWRKWSIPNKSTWQHKYLSLNSVSFGEFDLVPSFRGAKNLLKNIDLLVVGGWEAPFYMRTIFLAKRKRIPIILFYESTLNSHRFNNLLIQKIRSAILSQANFIVTAGSASTKAVTAMGIAPEKIITLFNPVDVNWFYAFAKDHRIPTTTGHRFIYVGQLIERKNIATVIRSFAEIKKDGDILIIAGDGPLSQELKNLAATLGISDSVNFVGHKNQEELAALYAASNTLILASTNEVWGLVVNEALASGLHAVVSDKCGVAEFVKDMSGAYICSTNQQSIEDMLIKSRDKWNGYIPEPEILKFTPERFAEGLMHVIDLANKSSSRPDLVWLTNIPTPYRISTWQILNSYSRFKVIFLNESERDRNFKVIDSLQGLNYEVINVKARYSKAVIPVYFNFYKSINAINRTQGKAIYIDGWESPAFFITALYARYINMKLIYGYRSTLDSHRFNNLLIQKIRSAILSQANFIVTAGSASTKAVTAMGIAPEKIITLFNPVDVNWFYAFAKDHRIPTTTGHRFIYVGQLIERKNIATVIRSFAEIKKDGDILIIAGDGPLSQELKNLAATLGISDSVNFVGHKNQEELAALYAASNTLILASTNEVWGLVVNEALASGLHAVVSDKCGVAEFVKDMSGAYICSTNQQSIEDMLIKSRDKWNGYIPEPEILKFTPERFAEGLLAYL